MMRTTTHHPPNAKRGVSSRRPTCCGETRPLASTSAAHARRGLRSAQFDEASQEVGVDVKHRLPNSGIFEIAVLLKATRTVPIVSPRLRHFGFLANPSSPSYSPVLPDPIDPHRRSLSSTPRRRRLTDRRAL